MYILVNHLKRERDGRDEQMYVFCFQLPLSTTSGPKGNKKKGGGGIRA